MNILWDGELYIRLVVDIHDGGSERIMFCNFEYDFSYLDYALIVRLFYYSRCVAGCFVFD